MAWQVTLTSDALDRARHGDRQSLADQVAGQSDLDLVAALASTAVVARCLSATTDGLRRVDLHAGEGISLLLDGDGGDPTTPRTGLVSTHLDALVHLVVESVGFGWRPVADERIGFDVDDPTDVPTGVLDLSRSALAARLGPAVDPAGLRWWSMQFPDSSSVLADELTVLDADRAGLFRQDGTRLEPTTTAEVWYRLQDVLVLG